MFFIEKVDVMSDSLYKTPIFVLLLSIFGYPIVAMFSLVSGVENQLTSIFYRLVIVFLSSLSIVCIGFAALKVKRNLSFYYFSFLLLSFFLIFIFRAILDSYMLASEGDITELSMFWMFLIGVTFLPTLAVALSWKHLTAQNAFLCSSGVFIGFASVTIILLVWVFYNGFDTLIGGRVEFATLNPISIGHIGVSLLIFSYAYIMTSKAGLFYKYLVFFISIGVGCLIIVAAGSRGPILSAAAVCIFCVAFSPKIKIYGKLGLTAIFFIFFVVVVSLFSDSMIVYRVTSGLFDDPVRNKILDDSLNILIGNPLIGGGVFTMDTYPHNFILESFVVGGVFCGVIYTAINLLALYAAVHVYKSCINIVIPMLFIQYFVAGLFSGTIHEAVTFWMSLSILLFQLSYCLSSRINNGL